MAKLSEFKNPIVAGSADVLNPADWVKSIGYIAFLGACVAIGAKALVKIDSVTPGTITPNDLAKTISKTEAKTVTIY